MALTSGVHRLCVLLCLALALAGTTLHAAAMELTVWSYATQKIPDSAIREFEATHPGVTVTQLQPAGAFTTDGFLAASAAGIPPDLIHLNEPFLAMYVANNLIVPLTKYIESGLIGELDVYFPGVVKTYQGAIWFIPHRISANTNFYNTQLIDEAGLDSRALPTTWAEFRETARKLTMGERIGALLSVRPNDIFPWFAPTLWQAGGDIFGPDGRLSIDTPEGLEALEFYVNAFQEGWAEPAWGTGQRSRLVSNEAVIFTHGNPVHMNEWIAEGIDWIQPGPLLQHRERAGFGSIAGWVITNGPNQDLAAELLAVSLRREHVVQFLAETNLFPVRRDIGIDYFAPENREWAQKFLNEVPYVRDQPMYADIAQLRAVIAGALRPALDGEMAPSAALQEAQRLGNASLK